MRGKRQKPKREDIISHLQVIHTWASFAIEHPDFNLGWMQLDHIAQWSLDAVKLLKEDERMEDDLK